MPGNIDRQSESMNGASGSRELYSTAPWNSASINDTWCKQTWPNCSVMWYIKGLNGNISFTYSQDVNNRVESQRRNSVRVSNEHAAATASRRMETPHTVSEADLSPSQSSPFHLETRPSLAQANALFLPFYKRPYHHFQILVLKLRLYSEELVLSFHLLLSV